MSEIKEKNLTGVSYQRLTDTALAVIYACNNNMPGAFVECGVENGGNSILAAKIFDFFNKENRVMLFDTFDGMTEPSDIDVSPFEGSGVVTYNAYREQDKKWCFASLEKVIDNFAKVGVPTDRCDFIVGDVNIILNNKNNIPSDISVLRLDTDWYESTKTEMDTLYPQLCSGGVLLLDDYGYWNGVKKAVDDFFEDRAEDPHFQFVDESGCNHIKK